MYNSFFKFRIWVEFEPQGTIFHALSPVCSYCALLVKMAVAGSGMPLPALLVSEYEKERADRVKANLQKIKVRRLHSHSFETLMIPMAL